MGLWDKIKSFFKGRKDEIKALPEAQSSQSNKNNQVINISRRNGDTIMLQPKLDRVGNQLFKTVLNHDTGKIHYIPEFIISDKSLTNAKSIHGATLTDICMDINLDLLKDETYNYYIAEVLLAPERMAEIIDENNHYAGGLNIGEAGQILGYHCSQGIIKGLKATTLENQRRYNEVSEARLSQENETQTLNLRTNIKTSHAEQLTPEMLEEFYGSR